MRNSNNNETIKYYKKIANQYSVLTAEEEKRLFIAYKDGDKKAEEIIFNSNFGLVISIVSDFTSKLSDSEVIGTDIDDFFQEGMIGLKKAVESFDLTKGYKFSTYATVLISRELKKFKEDCCRSVRLPSKKWEQIYKFFTNIKKLEELMGRELRNIEIVKQLNIDVAKVDELYVTSSSVLSLNYPIGDDEENEFGDLIEQNDTEFSFLRDDIERLFNKFLTEKEKNVLYCRTGFYSGINMTLEEIAEKYGVTYERVGQIEKEALSKLNKTKKFKEMLVYISDVSKKDCLEYSKPPLPLSEIQYITSNQR